MLQHLEKLDAKVNRPSYKKETNRRDSRLYWTISIKETIQWFIFLPILEHTESNTKTDISLLPSLLKVFAIFQMCLLYYEHN